MKSRARLQDLPWEELVADLREVLSTPAARIAGEAEPAPEDVQRWTAAQRQQDALLEELQSRVGYAQMKRVTHPSCPADVYDEFWARWHEARDLSKTLRRKRS
jgi:hypothetical protein